MVARRDTKDPRRIGRSATLVLCAALALAACGAAASQPHDPAVSRTSGGADAPARGTVDTRAAKPLHGLVVNLDPGHNPGNRNHPRRINRIVQAGPIRKACDTTGTATNAGWPEARFTLDLARRTARRLRAQGAVVTMVHDGDRPWGPCINVRGALGNRADVAISLHADGGPSSGRGFHVIRPGVVRGWTDDIAGRSRALALQLRSSMDRTGRIPRADYIGRDGLDVRTDLGGLLTSDVPKVFLEAGNMRNSSDARILRSGVGRERIAAAVTVAVVRWHRAEVAAVDTVSRGTWNEAG